MGMDVMGISPKDSVGETFCANLWAWRPIHHICEYLNRKHYLNFDTEQWQYNSGHGLNKKDALILADKLEGYIKNNSFLKQDDDKLYLCLGMWIDTNTNQSIRPQGISVQYPNGTILYSSVVTKAGDVVEPSHSVTLGHLKRFILFLQSCGGFEIF
jgi:hypothetical protein